MALICFFNSTHHICSQRQGWHRPWKKTCTLDWWSCSKERYHFGFTSTQHCLPLFQFYVSHCFLLIRFQPSSLSKSPLWKPSSFGVPTYTNSHPPLHKHTTIKITEVIILNVKDSKDYYQTVYTCYICILSSI